MMANSEDSLPRQAISAHIGSYVQEAIPILLKAVVGVVLGLGEQGMQPRICFHPGECWRILTLVGLQRILAGVGISRTVIGRFGCARSRPPQCLCGHAPRARSTGPSGCTSPARSEERRVGKERRSRW